MGKLSNFIIGAAIGAATSLVVSYLFAPAEETDGTGHAGAQGYRSRWDFAFEEGQRAAIERENELRQQLINAKKARGRQSW